MVNQIIRAKLGFLLLLTLIFMVAGCSNTDSENVNTDGIYADIRVTANGSGLTEVRVDLSVGSGGAVNTGLELSGGDTLTATDGTTSKPLVKENSILADYEYTTTFATEAADTKFTVSFIRPDGDSADNSFVTLPAPFNISTPSTTITGDGSSMVVLNWAPSALPDPISLFVDAVCEKTSAGGTPDTYIINEINNIPDTGVYNVSIQDLLDDPNPHYYNLGCEIELTMKRSRIGEIDSNFGEGGRIIASQTRSLNISYAPD